MKRYLKINLRITPSSLKGFVVLASYLFVQALLLANNVAANADKPKKIFMVMLYEQETMVEKAFKEYFQLKKRNVTFVGESIKTDKNNIPRVLERIKNEKPDLIYIYGTLPTIGVVGTYDSIDLKKHITNTPVVFTGLAQPVLSKVVKEWGPSGRNVTGLGLLVPEDVQINTMNLFTPIKKLVAVFNPVESQSNLVVKSLKATGEKQGFTVIECPVQLKEGIPDISSIPDTIAKAAAQKPDLVYFPSDAFIVTNMQAISNELIKHKLKSFIYNEFMINKKETALFGVVASLYSHGQKAALKADAILFGGEDVRTIPIEISKPFSVIFRKDTLLKTQAYPPLEFLDIAQGID